MGINNNLDTGSNVNNNLQIQVNYGRIKNKMGAKGTSMI